MEEKKEQEVLTPETESGFEEETVETEEEREARKKKNLTSAVILLAALFLGSLFVDVAQLVSGKGISQKVLRDADVFEYAGKTWVSFADPMVKLKVVTDESCGEKCNPAEALVGLKKYIPTIMTEKVEINSVEGKQLVEKFQLKSVPAYVFSKEIEKSEFFVQAGQFFDKKDDSFLLKTADLGVPAGKYIQLPEVEEANAQVGSKEAKVTVVEFSDFQCPYCKKMHEAVVSKMLKEYGDKINFVYKNLPLAIHPQAEPAAQAAMCANEQGKFIEFADKLYAAQEAWGKTKGMDVFKGYAKTLGLKTADFNKCLDDKKYAEQIKKEMEEAKSFGISGTPALFVGDQFFGGLVSYEEIKKALDEKLK